jgi:hypothetical protein
MPDTQDDLVAELDWASRAVAGTLSCLSMAFDLLLAKMAGEIVERPARAFRHSHRDELGQMFT